ncbi:polysaccharide biosynthesis/export family protein [Mucilaginibacter sp.]|uniref:polysaccharide biosynthesis/export family protein n=1 Tax=Mucilaginibacter sp. TaxID=1882438 RepID=UPI002633519D|nr:polysaccharide biosynthesis/export family protein [Mucilaginibacter sp.]MDB4925327.1 sugar transporter [Mucilaginibacter sp.]
MITPKTSILNLLILFVLLFTSCTPYKNIPYFQDLESTQASEEKIDNYAQLKIQPTDVLGINVTSRNPESSSIFNYNLTRANGNNYNTSPDNPVIGYLVDEKGFIHLPLIGDFQVAGLTTSQIRDKLSIALQTFYKDPVVNIRILNFKISVYGDVARPNVYTLQNEQTSITEAISLAGDLNITAMRKNVLLIRFENGERKYIHLDLTSKKLMESPYFYLKNNDQIYVQPGKSKFASVNDAGFRAATLILSGLSIIAILVSRSY